MPRQITPNQRCAEQEQNGQFIVDQNDISLQQSNETGNIASIQGNDIKIPQIGYQAKSYSSNYPISSNISRHIHIMVSRHEPEQSINILEFVR